ncbi:MAG: hypothetical protein R2773_04995 [Flavobacteriaceae bacterium]
MKTTLKTYALLLSLLLASCASYYDHYTLSETVFTKVMVESLINKATSPYADHEAAVKTICNFNFKKCCSTRKQKEEPNHAANVGLIEFGKLLPTRILKTWKDQGTLNPVFIEGIF